MKCDICSNIKETKYKNYYHNINSNQLNKYACSQKCVTKRMIIINELNGHYKYSNQDPNIKKRTYLNSLKNIKKYDKSLVTINPDWLKYLITKEVMITINKWNIEHLFNLGYSNLKQNTKWIIPVQHLTENSSIKIECKCECGSITNTTFQKFMTNYNRSQSYNCKHCNNITLKKTLRKKYNVDNILHLEEYQRKSKISRYGIQIYENISYQGSYELDFLKYCEQNNILNKISKPKSIKYEFNNKEKRYYPDFYIKDINLIIEIKSSYFFELHEEQNLKKKESCIKQGFSFLFIINKDYEKFNEILKTIHQIPSE